MSTVSVSTPFPIFTDSDGQPLENGYIWVGTANLNPIVNPINVYWDAALTIPAAQPIRTLGGYPINNGTPARLYVNSQYSIQVQNRNGSVVYSAPVDTEFMSSANVSYTPAGTGAVPTTVETKLRQIVSVKDFGAVGDGVTDDYAAITSAIAYANSIGCILFFPPGVYLTTTTLVFKNNVIYRGSGLSASGTLGTRIYYTGASDAIQINNPINSNTSAYIVIEDIYVQCATRTLGKASIADVGSSYLYLNRVRVYGNDYGVILDQSEIVRLQDCNIGVTITNGTAGVWLVNDGAHTPGALSFFTNRIIIDGCQFDAGTVGQCIADDGGVSHTFSNNNFNAGGAAIRLTNVQGLLISGNEIETTTNASISFNVTTLAGAVGNFCTAATVNSNYFSNSSAIAFILFQSSSVQKYIGCGNTFNNANAGGAPYSGVAAGVFDFYGAGNFQTGTGSTVVGNTVGPLTTYTPTFASSNGNASIGNGTISGSYTRTGANITVNINFAVGSTTTLGTGQWRFGLPFVSSGAITYVGSFIGLSAGATFRVGASDVNGGLNYARIWENAVGPLGGASYAWANGDFVYVTITYPVSQAL